MKHATVSVVVGSRSNRKATVFPKVSLATTVLPNLTVYVCALRTNSGFPFDRRISTHGCAIGTVLRPSAVVCLRNVLWL